MPNGRGLHGHRSSTQSAIIIPHPGNKKRYFVFTVDQAEILPGEPKDGLSYSEVDMNLNNGLGDVIPETKNIHLVTYNSDDAKQREWKSSEKLTAVMHEDGKSYWVLTHFVDMFYAFKVDINGVSEIPVTTKVNEKVNIVESFEQEQRANVTALGYLKISPNGEKIAIVHSSTQSSRTSGKVYLYDFDSSTGKVSNSGQEILRGHYPYGVEFSPKSKKLYVSVNNFRTLGKESINFVSSALYQFDLDAPNIAASKKEIHTSISELAGALQLAINGKIYRAKFDIVRAVGGTSLAAINRPEFLGDLCDYESRAVELASGTSSWYGLPSFVTSLFLFSFDYEFTCLGEETHFFLTSEEPFDSLLWKFEDGTTYENERDIYHEFSTPGSHIVTLETITNSIPNKDVIKTIEIIDLVEVLDSFELIQCVDDEISVDGKVIFNLQLANEPISLGNEETVDVYYYEDLAVLHDDLDNSRALPNFYTNSIPNELLYAKVIKADSYCYGVSEITLNAKKTITIPTNTFVGCNLGNGTGQFDLESQKKVIIKNDRNLDPNTTISYHLTKRNAILGYNPISNDYVSEAKSIFLRIENENICYGTGELVLEIYNLPKINLKEELNICRTSFPIRINAGVAANERIDFTFGWETGENTHELEIYDAGEFNVLITNKATGCDQLRTIRVNNINQPEIQEIVIEDNLDSYTATIRTNEGDGLLYALNNDFGVYRNDPVFTNLAPGVYTAYVSDSNNCNTVEKQFYIFGFPKFFTPNNDGYNDYWEVKGIDKSVYTYSDVHVFDRFGKFLVKFKADANWNGTYNGKNLPPDDYWYKVTVTDQKNNTTSHTGHFSIVK